MAHQSPGRLNAGNYIYEAGVRLWEFSLKYLQNWHLTLVLNFIVANVIICAPARVQIDI
jgi:hypothetical protein